MEGIGIPNESIPGVRKWVRRVIPASQFAGCPGPEGYEFSSTSDLPLKALISLDDIWPGADIYYAVLWSTSSSTTTNTATFRVRHVKIVPDTTALATATVAVLGTAITADAAATANSLRLTPEGYTLGGILSNPTDLILVAVDLPTVSGFSLDPYTGDKVVFHGLRIRYQRGNL